MSVLTWSEINSLFLDRAQANVATDAPLNGSTENLRFLNEAYADVWEVSGGSIKKVSSFIAWVSEQTSVDGLMVGQLTDIRDLMHVYASTTAAVVFTGDVTSASATVSNVSSITGLKLGMELFAASINSGLGNTYITKLTAGVPPNLTMSRSGSAIQAGEQITARNAGGVGDVELDRVEESRIQWLRGASGLGTYTTPKVYAVRRYNPAVDGDTNKLMLELHPALAGFYLPIHYVPQFTPATAIDTSHPDVNDLESRDIPLLAAAKFAPLNGRAELVPSIVADISERTAKVLERKLKALMSAEQDAA